MDRNQPAYFCLRNVRLEIYLTDFRVRILWSKHAGCCETWEKRKNKHEQLAECFSFSKVEQHPKCLDHSIQTRGSILYFFYKITTDKKQLTKHNDEVSNSPENHQLPIRAKLKIEPSQRSEATSTWWQRGKTNVYFEAIWNFLSGIKRNAIR